MSTLPVAHAMLGGPVDIPRTETWLNVFFTSHSGLRLECAFLRTPPLLKKGTWPSHPRFVKPHSSALSKRCGPQAGDAQTSLGISFVGSPGLNRVR